MFARHFSSGNQRQCRKERWTETGGQNTVRKHMKVFLKLLLWSTGLEIVLFLVDSSRLPFLSDIAFYLQEPALNIGGDFWPDIGNSRIGLVLVPWFFLFVLLTIIFALNCVFQRLKSKPDNRAASSGWFSFGSLAVMDETSKGMADNPKISSFDRAAWFSLITPLAATAITFGLFLAANYSHSNSLSTNNLISGVLGCEFLMLFVSLIFGIVSLFGIQRHKRKLTLWIALFGILASGVAWFGVLALIVLMSGTGRY